MFGKKLSTQRREDAKNAKCLISLMQSDAYIGMNGHKMLNGAMYSHSSFFSLRLCAFALDVFND